MAAQLDLRLERDPVAAEKPLQKAPRAGLSLQQHQREPGKLRQRVGPVLAGEIRRRHKDVVQRHAVAHPQVFGLLRGAGKGQIHLARPQHLQHLIAGAVQYLDADGGVHKMELLQIIKQKVSGHGVTGADDKIPQHQLAGLLQLVLSRFDQPDGVADIVEQHPSLCRQGDAAGLAGKQPHLQLLLQLADGLADRRLGNIQRLGGVGNALLLGHLTENTVKIQLDCHFSASFAISTAYVFY